MLDTFIHKNLRTPYTLNVDILQSPRRARKTLVLIHGIGSSTIMWRNVVTTIPADVRVVAIDLLGFGKSPHPEWATYDATTQARSIIKTLIRHRIPLRSVFVGHSLGALVAVEVARRAPLYVSRIVLVSPPIYKPSRGKLVATQKEDLLRGLYKTLHRYPKNTERALAVAKKYYVKRTGAKVELGMNINSFLAALESAVINQNTIEHIRDVKVPTTIVSGSRDPLIVTRNLHRLAKNNDHIEHRAIKKAGHNVVGVMAIAVRKILSEIMD